MNARFRIAAISITAMVGSMVSVSSLSALSIKSKPTAPIVRSILSRAGSSKTLVNVSVSFQLGKTHSRAPLLLTQVKIGTRICTATKLTYSCLLKNVKVGREVRVLARAKNKNGFGPWSSAVLYSPKVGNRWTITTPAIGSSPANPSVTPTTPSSPVSVALRFNLNGAVGLAMTSSVNTSSVRRASTESNLKAINAAGTLTDAVASGTATVSKFYIAPNNKLFVLFSTKTTVGGVQCLLAEVDRTSGEPKCIESDMSSLTWDFGTNRSTNPPIQFDGTGAIYYAGTPSTGGNFQLKKYSNGTTTSLLNDNMRLFDLLVLEDGNVIISGETTSSGSRWIRKISPTGGLSTLAGDQAYFLRRFPDGNVYFALYGQGIGIKRYVAATNSVDTRPWIASVNNGAVNPYNNSDPICYPTWIDTDGFCVGNFGISTKSFMDTSSGSTFVVTGSQGTQGTLMKYFPTLSRVTTEVKRVVVSQRVLDYLILSGINTTGQNITTMFNTSTNTEQTLIPSSSEIEVYHLNYVAASNKIMFDGLRFSDNKYVIGQIDLNTGQMTASQTGSSKLADFQTFAS